MKKQLTVLLILFFVSLAITSSVRASENSILTSHWDFNEGSGNIVHDSIGGHNAIVSGLAQWGDGFIDFNSGNRDVANGHASTGYWTPSTNNFTLIISVKVGAAQGDNSFLFVNNGFQLKVPGNTQSVRLEGFGVSDYIGVELLGVNKIALVHNGSTIKIFKNGQYIKTFNNVSPMSGSWDWFFGGNVSYITSQYYDVKLYNIALTNDDVATEFNNGAVSCTEDIWSCNAWNECSFNGAQTRSCIKTYDCSAIDTPSPSTSQSCTPICTANNYSCSAWGSCSVNGSQTRTCNKIFDCNGGVQPLSSQSCNYIPPTCTSFTYSDWGACQSNSTKTRTIVTRGPENCTGGNPILTESCSYIAPCVVSDWSCNSWATCSINGIQTRTCNKTSNCQGGVSAPVTSQSCTYIPTCTSYNWSCSSWSTCSSSGTQTRTCSKTSNCEGGVSSPAISQSCTYTPACISLYYSSWSECTPDGKQTRSLTSKYPTNCEGGELPKLTQSCTYTPPCNSDTWQCGSWGTCSPQGIQTRTCSRIYDCPSVETAAPTTSQYCESSYKQNYQTPSANSDIVTNQDAIIKATVKLLCPVSKTMASQGSGTVIGQSGLILTNKHVIEGTPGCLVGFIDDYDDEPYFGDRQIADIYKVSSDADVAVLKLRNPNNKSITAIDITTGNSSNLRLGNQITTYGYPAKFGTKITYTSGDFSGVDGNYLKTTAIIEHGNSGGGAYLKNGTFIGIPTAVIKGNLNSMGYLLSVNKVNSWLNNSIAYNYNNNNNNYSRVSALLEDMDLNALDSLGLFVAGDEANIKTATESQKVIAEEKQLITKIDNNLSKRVNGKILLQVEKNGEGWYVYPDDKKKYYLGRPADAFNIMRNLGLGIKHSELANYLNSKFPSRLSGKIMLDVEQNGEAYYINPNDLKGYYLNRPADAFRIMRELGLGITNSDIRKIDIGEVN